MKKIRIRGAGSASMAIVLPALFSMACDQSSASYDEDASTDQMIDQREEAETSDDASISEDDAPAQADQNEALPPDSEGNLDLRAASIVDAMTVYPTNIPGITQVALDGSPSQLPHLKNVGYNTCLWANANQQYRPTFKPCNDSDSNQRWLVLQSATRGFVLCQGPIVYRSNFEFCDTHSPLFFDPESPNDPLGLEEGNELGCDGHVRGEAYTSTCFVMDASQSHMGMVKDWPISAKWKEATGLSVTKYTKLAFAYSWAAIPNPQWRAEPGPYQHVAPNHIQVFSPNNLQKKRDWFTVKSNGDWTFGSRKGNPDQQWFLY